MARTPKANSDRYLLANFSALAPLSPSYIAERSPSRLTCILLPLAELVESVMCLTEYTTTKSVTVQYGDLNILIIQEGSQVRDCGLCDKRRIEERFDFISNATKNS